MLYAASAQWRSPAYIKSLLFGPEELSYFPRILLECNRPVENQLEKEKQAGLINTQNKFLSILTVLEKKKKKTISLNTLHHCVQ